MNDRDEHDPRGSRSPGRSHQVTSRHHVLLTLVLGIALVAMLIGHRQALASGDLVVIALVVACLLIHPLMHRGHGGRRGARERRDDQP